MIFSKHHFSELRRKKINIDISYRLIAFQILRIILVSIKNTHTHTQKKRKKINFVFFINSADNMNLLILFTITVNEKTNDLLSDILQEINEVILYANSFCLLN